VSKKIFVSHSSKDADIVNGIVKFLEKNDITCWLAPRNITGGRPYASEIVSAIVGCDKILFIASLNSNDSEHVLNEIDIGVRNGKEIVPLRIENFVLNYDFIYYLGRKHEVRAFPERIEHYYPDILRTLNSEHYKDPEQHSKERKDDSKDVSSMFHEHFLTIEDLMEIERNQTYLGKRLVRLDIVTNSLSLADGTFSKIMNKNLREGIRYAYYHLPSDNNMLIAEELKEFFISSNISFTELDDKEWFFLVDDFFFTIYTLQDKDGERPKYAGVMSNATNVSGKAYNTVMSDKLVTRIRSILLKYRTE
jgi:hypothetical protein